MPAGAQRADPLHPMAAREHPWAVPRRVPRGCPTQCWFIVTTRAVVRLKLCWRRIRVRVRGRVCAVAFNMHTSLSAVDRTLEVDVDYATLTE